MATYDLTQSTPTKIQIGDILNCPYSGTSKSITLPAGTYKLECWGAQGGGAIGSGNNNYIGGCGGYSIGTLCVNTNTVLYLYVGGAGITDNRSNQTYTLKNGGFNGGGNSYSAGSSGSGGGATDVRIQTDSLFARVIVAGAGGGAGWSSAGFAGGGLQGISYNNTISGITYYSGGGSQTSGGAHAPNSISHDGYSVSSGGFGFGGIGVGNSSGGGAGGSGWYGGGGSGYAGGSGGGSGYVYTSSTAGNYPSGCLLTSNYYLTDASTIAGNTSFLSPTGSYETGHTGNGYIRITVIPTIYIINSVGSSTMHVPDSLKDGDALRFNITNTDTTTCYAGTILSYTFPVNCVVKIDAYGARGSYGNLYTYGITETSRSGNGAHVYGTFTFKKNDQVLILVGQHGKDAMTSTSSTRDQTTGAGGGGTFVVKRNTDGSGDTFVGSSINNSDTAFGGWKVSPLLIAAGGNGSRDNGYSGTGTIYDGSYTMLAQPNYASYSGGGYSTSYGTATPANYGQSFLNGGIGAQTYYTRTTYAIAGFGGGGGNYDDGTGGGGGGYYGGLRGVSACSYNAGSDTGGTSGINNSDGYVVITILKIAQTPLYMKINDSIKEATKTFVKIDNSWKSANEIKMKVNDQWK